MRFAQVASRRLRDCVAAMTPVVELSTTATELPDAANDCTHRPPKTLGRCTTMSRRRHSSTNGFAPRPRRGALIVLSATTFVASHLVACGDNAKDEVVSGGSAGAASGGATASDNGLGGTATAVGDGIGGAGFNQCGVAAPLPKETGQCTSVSAPLIANFDDFTGTDAASYGFTVNAGTATAASGAIQHVGDGSDADGGSSVISTEMVTGEGGTGYALQFANTNALNWGGLLMLYVPGSATTLHCLNAQTYSGVQFSIKGSSPSGRFGVSMNLLDTIATADNGLCNNAVAADCKNASLELQLPKDAEVWTKVQVPWSALTPGVGSALSCVPVTGQNLVRLVIQPFMSYPPPDYAYQGGPYSITVDNVSFY